jgi:hypothetical protein
VKKTAEPAPAATTARTIQLNENEEALFREFMRRRKKPPQ